MKFDDDALTYEIGLSGYRNITLSAARHLAESNISPADFFTADATALAALSHASPDFFNGDRRQQALERARQEHAFIDNSHLISATFYTGSRYPKRLLECDDAPALLYYAGNAEAANARHSIAVVGTRHCTAYGADFTRRLVTDLATALGNDLLIVSGLAYGIDICAHRAALDAGVPTAAVLAHGLHTLYPADHRSDATRIINNGGFLATEYTSQSTMHRGNFLARNRIVAGMADVVIVIESDLRGGAMATARIAGEYNREVMAVPGRVSDTYSRGTNALIAGNRAALLRDADDILALMGWQATARAGEQAELTFDIPESYRPVLDTLQAHPESTVNDLCVALDMPFAQLSTLLFRMEMDDFIVALPGGRYTLPATYIKN